MPDYIQKGSWADAGLAIMIGLFIGLFAASLANGSTNKDTPVKATEKPAQVQIDDNKKPEPKPAPAAHSQPKEDCTFWRTMTFANSGKSMWAYYYTQWQACEARQ